MSFLFFREKNWPIRRRRKMLTYSVEYGLSSLSFLKSQFNITFAKQGNTCYWSNDPSSSTFWLMWKVNECCVDATEILKWLKTHALRLKVVSGSLWEKHNDNFALVMIENKNALYNIQLGSCYIIGDGFGL